LDGGPCDVDKLLDMEKCDLYLEDAEEDMKRGFYTYLQTSWRSRGWTGRYCRS
jgi:hypothetical protein